MFAEVLLRYVQINLQSEGKFAARAYACKKAAVNNKDIIDGARRGTELKDSDAPKRPLAVVVYGATSPLTSQDAGFSLK